MTAIATATITTDDTGEEFHGVTVLGDAATKADEQLKGRGTKLARQQVLSAFGAGWHSGRG